MTVEVVVSIARKMTGNFEALKAIDLTFFVMAGERCKRGEVRDQRRAQSVIIYSVPPQLLNSRLPHQTEVTQRDELSASNHVGHFLSRIASERLTDLFDVVQRSIELYIPSSCSHKPSGLRYVVRKNIMSYSNPPQRSSIARVARQQIVSKRTFMAPTAIRQGTSPLYDFSSTSLQAHH